MHAGSTFNFDQCHFHKQLTQICIKLMATINRKQSLAADTKSELFANPLHRQPLLPPSFAHSRQRVAVTWTLWLCWQQIYNQLQLTFIRENSFDLITFADNGTRTKKKRFRYMSKVFWRQMLKKLHWLFSFYFENSGPSQSHWLLHKHIGMPTLIKTTKSKIHCCVHRLACVCVCWWCCCRHCHCSPFVLYRGFVANANS